MSVADISFIRTLTLAADGADDTYTIAQGFSSGSALTVNGGAILDADDDEFIVTAGDVIFEVAAEANAAAVTEAGEWFFDSTGVNDLIVYWDEVAGARVTITLVGSADGAVVGNGDLVYTA